ncbi:MAG: WbqC family protein [Lachnospiraceae bacterium]|nr:WbqC family protein [Lachnospiraceae bacterium]
MKKVGILQSNYIPWKGYFDIINMVDEFILYDDMQYTRRDWRNRNKIMTKNGPIWLTIPVDVKGKYYQKINETKVLDKHWIDEHKKALQCNYGKAPFFREYKDIIFEVYDKCQGEDYLSHVNYLFLKEVCKILGINTRITWSSDYNLADGKTERLVQLVKDAGGDYYLSGPAAKAYIDQKLFEEENIKLGWMDYSGYPEYPQIGREFEHGISILDLIFMVGGGEEALEYLKKGRKQDD